MFNWLELAGRAIAKADCALFSLDCNVLDVNYDAIMARSDRYRKLSVWCLARHRNPVYTLKIDNHVEHVNA